MSNRPRLKQARHTRHPRLATAAVPEVPPQLQHLDWTDEPAGQYPTQTVEWIAAHAAEALRLNVWECEDCGMPVLCFDRHPGVTPFMVAHSTLGGGDCKGMCRSHFYNGASARAARDVLGQPSHEWYRPSAHELKRLRGQVRDHVLKGGLLVRAVVAA
jgi:hypothetical protein